MNECLKMIVTHLGSVDDTLHPWVLNAVFENPNIKTWLTTTDSDGTQARMFSQVAFTLCALPLATWYLQYALDDDRGLRHFFDFLIRYEFDAPDPDFDDVWGLCFEKLSGWRSGERKHIATRKLYFIAVNQVKHLNSLDQIRGACKFWDESQKFMAKPFITNNLMKPFPIDDNWKPSFFGLVHLRKL